MADAHIDGALTVEFIDERIHLGPGDSLRFGRQGDLVVDDNPFLHRVVGRFSFREGFWWLQNHGSRTELAVTETATGARSTLGPGQQAPLIATAFTVTFTAGPTHYELLCVREGPEFTTDDTGVPVGTATIDFGVIPLSHEQHLLLVALCEQRLTGHDTVPTNQAIADRLDWTLTKFNRKLDAVCSKLSRQGVRGLRGSVNSLASDRRTVLVQHALQARLVTVDDLGILPHD